MGSSSGSSWRRSSFLTGLKSLLKKERALRTLDFPDSLIPTKTRHAGSNLTVVSRIDLKFLISTRFNFIFSTRYFNFRGSRTQGRLNLAVFVDSGQFFLRHLSA